MKLAILVGSTVILAGCAKEPPKPSAEEIARQKIRSQAQAQLALLRPAKEEGRIIDRIAVTVSKDGERVKFVVQNKSIHPLMQVKVEVLNAKAWDRYLNERYNGILVKDLPRHMRPDWLRSTGYWETYNRIRSETHKVFDIRIGVDAEGTGTYFTALPSGFEAADELKIRIYEVSDASGRPWCRLAELEEWDFMSKI